MLHYKTGIYESNINSEEIMNSIIIEQSRSAIYNILALLWELKIYLVIIFIFIFIITLIEFCLGFKGDE